MITLWRNYLHLKHVFTIIIFASCFIYITINAQYKGNLDSLKRVVAKSPGNLEALSKLTQSLEYSNMDTSYKLTIALYQKAKKMNSQTHIIMSEQLFGNYHMVNNRLDSAAFYFDKMVESAKHMNDTTMMASGLSSRGQVSVTRGDIGEGIRYFQECLVLMQPNFDTERDPDGLADCYGFLGDAYYLAGLYEESLENQFKCLDLLTTHKKI